MKDNFGSKNLKVKRQSKQSKSKMISDLYDLPKSYNQVYGFKDFSKRPLSIWHWNVNGINAVLTKKLFQNFLDTANPDILCLNEIKIDQEKI